jgi:hypothetical protein
MARTGEINQTSGIYRSTCCGHERAIPKGHRFPPCGSCGGPGAGWQLVRVTHT